MPIGFQGWARRSAILILLGAIVWTSVARTRLEGDGLEYLLTTRALAGRASPFISAADAQYFLNLPPLRIYRVGISRAPLQLLAEELKKDHPDFSRFGSLGFFRGVDHRVYSCHFWFFSLLAVPFFWVTSWIGVNPMAGYTLLNMVLIGAAFLYLGKGLRLPLGTAFATFLLAGSSFYLNWTGPEILTALAALIAGSAALRGRIGTSWLAAAIGSLQNPPLLLMVPFLTGLALLTRKWPISAAPEVHGGVAWKRQALLGLVSIPVMATPFLFFLYRFGVPSLIARYYLDPGLATFGRLHSLFFDLNQGMAVGVPGLLLTWIVALVVVLRRSKRRLVWIMAAVLVLASVLVAAFAVLPAKNWNCGCRVMSRYAYWLAMPLLALLWRFLSALPSSSGRAILGAFVAIQLLILTFNGFYGERSGILRHNRLASWVLKHHPTWYNPEAEIMIERTLGVDGALQTHDSLLYRHAGKPMKFLRQWSDLYSNGGLCPEGSYLCGSRVRNVSGGWEYLHPPFRCLDLRSMAESGLWSFAAADRSHHKLLGQGWSGQEEKGIWSDGWKSELRIPVPEGMRIRRLRIAGFYYGEQSHSEVTINGIDLGNRSLADGDISLPDSLSAINRLDVVLEHPQASSPASRGESNDSRRLGFFLIGLKLEGDNR